MKNAHPADLLLAESSWVKRLATRLLRDTQAAEDLSQEVLKAALEQQPHATGPHLRAWLATVTRRLAAKRAARETRRYAVERAAARQEADDRDVTERLRLHRWLVDKVEGLPPLLREAVLLRFFDDLSPQEISARLGIPANTVRKRLSRGLQQLRESLDEGDRPSHEGMRRVLGIAALAEAFGSPPATSTPAAASLITVPMMLKLFLPVLVTVSAFGLWRSAAMEPAPAATSRSNSRPPTLSAESLLVAAPSEDGRSPAVDTTWLKVRTHDGQIPTDPFGYWFEPDGTEHALTFTSNGKTAIDDVPVGATIWVSANHAVATRSLRAKGQDPSVLLLEEGRQLDLTVYAEGSPAAALVLTAMWEGPLSDLPLSQAVAHELRIGTTGTGVWTNSSGQFLLQGIPLGAEVQLFPPQTYGLDPGLHPSASVHVTVSSSESAFELHLLERAVFKGRVVHALDGLPVPRCKVTVTVFPLDNSFFLSASDWTKDDGTFEAGLHFEPWLTWSDADRTNGMKNWGDLEIVLEPKGEELQKSRVQAPFSPRRIPFDLGTLELETSDFCAAKIGDAFGNPIENAVLFIPGEELMISDANGLVRFSRSALEEKSGLALASGFAVKEVEASELPFEEETLVITLEPGIEVEFELDSPGILPAGLQLHVTGEVPLFPLTRIGTADTHNWMAQATGDSGILTPWEFSTGHWTASTTFTEPQTVRMIGLQSGISFRWSLQGPDQHIYGEGNETTPGNPGVLRVPLSVDYEPIPEEEQTTVRGRLVDEEGQPLENIQVTIRFVGFEVVRTALDGTFESSPFRRSELVRARRFSLQANPQGRLGFFRTWNGPVAELQPLEFTLPPARSVSLRFVDAAGQHLRAEEVEVDRGEDRLSGAQRTARGLWQAHRIPLGETEATIHVGTKTYSLLIPPGEASAELMLPAHGTLVLRGSSTTTSPGAWAQVRRLSDATQAGKAIVAQSAAKEALYAGMAASLLPGPYEVSWGEGEPVHVQIEAGETTRVEITAP